MGNSRFEGEPTGSEIAVIGMAGRFPGATTLETFWGNVRDGVESVKFFTEEELTALGESTDTVSDPAYVRAWPQLEGIELFDANFFGISPRDAAVMDPQHRFFLEVAWEAMERAGYSGKSAPIATGIFAAAGMNHYMLHHLVPNKEVMQTVGEWLVRHTSNDMNFLATRAAYQMNLKGPALNIQTACSSSLVAIHLACQSLLNHETDLALAGASTMSLPQDRGYLFKQGEILSADGHCRPFDANSTGTLFGSGAGVVVLKRLADAIEDGDTIASVIRGSAINNDGSQKVGYLAPSVDGQARAISEALAIAGVPADSIGFVETHGTGTVVGDPIEVAALVRAYAPLTHRKQFVALNSVKANIGHLGEAAGMAGFIKTSLALHHAQLPPTVNYSVPNPEIDFDSSPFYVNASLAEWPAASQHPRRAGVTALGAGGTNAHLILEEAPPSTPTDPSARCAQVLALSARTPTALDAAAAGLADFFVQSPDANLADTAYTLQVGRTAFPYRRTVVATSAAAAVEALRKTPEGAVTPAPQTDARIIFMFPGGGAQYAGMGRELYENEPVYTKAFEDCLNEMPDAVSGALRRLVCSKAADAAAAATELESPRLALPALFATEYAVSQLLQHWGLVPAGMIGHSMGEYVAACLSGVLTLRDALTLVMERARLFESLPAGAMLSVELPEASLLPLLGADLSIAAVNGPGLCVASGPVAAIERLQAELDTRDVENMRIHISVAAHSAMLEPILAEFTRVCARVRFSPPRVPFISNLTGAWITADEATDPQYWVRHLRQTVRFDDGLTAVLADGRNILLEIGPGRTLSSFARARNPSPVALPTLRHVRESASDVSFLLGTVGRVWETGGPVALEALHGETRRRRIPLPTYPFERQRFWIDAGVRSESSDAELPLVRKPEISDWFSVAAWRRSAPVRGDNFTNMPVWLVFADQSGVAESIAKQRTNGTTILVSFGDRFERRSDKHFALRADAYDDYTALIAALELSGHWPDQIVHMWGLETARSGFFDRARDAKAVQNLERAESELYRSMLSLVQAMAEQERPLVLSAVASGLFACQVGEAPEAAKSLLLGPVLVTPREFPHIQSRCIDVLLDGATAAERAARLIPELERNVKATAIAVRPRARWVRGLDTVSLDAATAGVPLVRDRATVIITGGLGGIGLEVAEHLARTARARLILVGRTSMPPREQWQATARHGDSELLRSQATKLLAIEAAGGEVLTIGADVTDLEQMTDAVAAGRKLFGGIHGVIHAAGVIDDGLMSLKPVSGTSRVIDIKARGALVLDRVLRNEPLEFFMTFSSISAVLGLEGQVDYTAANAFLDAFIERKRSTGNVRAISVGWNAWREVGMAATIAENSPHGTGRSRGRPGPHPDLERLASDSGDTLVYTTLFSRARQWLIAEHVVRGGDALIPGTGFLELARGTLEAQPEARTSEIRNVTFLRPFVVGRSDSRSLHLSLTRAGNGNESFNDFTFSGARDEPPFVTGAVGYTDATPLADGTLESIRARMGSAATVGGFIDQKFMDFGPRWANVRDIAVGAGEALIHLQLPDEFIADLATYKLHPAMLDMATGGAQQLIPGFNAATDFYVPFAYERVQLFASLKSEVFSHVQFRSGGRGETARFDVQLFASDGTVLAQIRGFTMKRIASGTALTGVPESGDAETPRAAAARNSQLGAQLKLGISSAEGVDAFDRIMASGLDGHILASSIDLPRWLESLSRQQVRAVAHADNETVSGGGFERPALGTSFVGPRNSLEEELAELWKQLLGVKEIGIHDDFFELGGQSLVAVRLFNRIRKRFNVDLPLSTLFEAPTIAQCAVVIADEAGIELTDTLANSATSSDTPDASRSVSATTESASLTNGAGTERAAPEKSSRWRTLVAIQSRGSLPPFVCVAGMGGTLNNLRPLAMLMGESRPFYGLQPPGADDMSRLLYSVEELAAHYIEELRKVLPNGPYCLGGYSGGGVAAFEMARQLTAAGETVEFLGFIDSFSPALPQRSLAERARIHGKRVRDNGPGYLWDTVIRRVAMERGNMKMRLSRPLRRIMPDRYRYEAVAESWVVAESRYLPAPQDRRATLFRAREESATSLWTAVKVDEQHGWGRYLLQGVDVQLCPGNHSTMCEEPNVRVLAAKLRSALLAASPETAATSER